MTDFHPYSPFIPRYATKLILGSIPPHRFCKNEFGEVYGDLHPNDVDFYYGSYRNEFWKIIQEVFDTEFEFTLSAKAIQQRKSFLEINKIAMFDVVQSCKRVENKSSDKDLYDIQWTDLFTLLEQNPNIRTIFCTSQFVRTAALKILNPKDVKKQNEVWSLELQIRKLELIQLYSPSPLLIRALGKEGKQKRLKQYEKYLKTISI